MRAARQGLCRLSIVAVCLGVPLLIAGRAHAQRDNEYTRALALLPADLRPVVDRLGSLHELPDGAWKIHAGDLAHGEDPNLDDSAWDTIAPGAVAPRDSVWFRQSFTVPDNLNGYDLTGSRIWFQFHVDGDGPMPEILYFNGRRVALGEDLEPTVLFENAKPGDRVTVAVKLLHTESPKDFHGATLRVDFSENRPNPEDLREEILSAAELLPSLAPGDAGRESALEAAVHAVDMSALDARDQSKFDASLIAAEAQMQTLKPVLGQATFHLTGNSHIDAAWLWPWTETVDVVRRTFSTALELMYEYPQYTYTQSAAAYNDWMAQKYPDMNAEIKKRIQEGRWEVVGGMWVEPDLNMPDGESLVRQLLVGKRWYKQAYGVDVRIGWNPDSFGYTWQLPQIYKKSGIDYFVTQKMAWNDTNQLPFKLFWWQSPDGSKVLTYFPHGYGNDSLNPVRLSEDLRVAREHAPGMLDMMDLYGIGDHGGGPTRDTLDQGFHHVGTGHVTPKYEFGIAQSYFSAIETQIAPDSPTWNYQSIAKGYKPPQAVEGKVAIPTWNSELYFEYHRGIYTTQAAQKHNIRTGEEEVLNAEKWSSFAWLDGRAYPGVDLTEDWKKVLFNEFHDLAAGSGIGVIYKDAQKDFDVVRLSTSEISAAALDTIAEHVNTSGEGIPVLVYNPLGWDRSGDVSIQVQLPEPGSSAAILDPSAGKEPEEPETASIDPRTGAADLTFHVSGVPALGYKLVRVVSGKHGGSSAAAAATDQGAALQLSDHGLSVTVDKKTGCITSLQLAGFESLAKGGCGNELQAFKDTPTKYDAWNIDPGTLDQTPTLIDAANSVELLGAKSSNPAIRVTRTWQSSKFVQTITIPPGSGLIDVDNEIDWHERHVLLKAAFPLAATSDFATYEVPFAEIDRPTTRTNSWDKAQFEVEAERWADLGDGKHGFSLLNKDKYGYDAAGNVLRLSLLRSPTWPDPEADQGHHHFHYALYPHAGTWKDALTVRHGWEYDYTLEAVATANHGGSLPAQHSFASVGPETVALTAVKKAEDANSLIFRAYEWAGKETTAEFHVPPGATTATVTNLMETPEGSPLQIAGDVVRVPIHPFEILTIRVDYPAK
jgi:alpha-mannosidase